jgi:hypothetical protein
VCDLVITVVGIYGADSRQSPGLTDNVKEQNLCQGPIVRESIPFTIYLLGNKFVLPCLLEHSLAVDNFIGHVKIGFHQQYRP